MWRPPPSLGALPRRATDGGHGRRPALPRSGAAAFATAGGRGRDASPSIFRSRPARSGVAHVGASRAPNVTGIWRGATKDAVAGQADPPTAFGRSSTALKRRG